MKINLFIIALLMAACQSSEQKEAQQMPSPDYLAFEFERIKSPLTGTVPSELRFAELPARMGGALAKSDRVYPNSWRNIDDQFASLAVTKLAYDPNDPSVYYFCTGEGFGNADQAKGAGVWKSTDAGESWQRLMSTDSFIFDYCADLVVDDNGDIYVATRDGGVQRSQNGGQTWTEVISAGNGSNSTRSTDLELTADGELFVAFGQFSSDGLYYSASGDAGSWEKRMNGMPGNDQRIVIATAPNDKDIIYCVTQASDRKVGGIYRSEDKGQNWTTLALPGGDREYAKLQAWYDLTLEVDPNNPDILATGGLNIWRSRDAGQTWQQLTEGDRRKNSSIQYVHVDQHEIVFQNSDTVYFMNDGGIYRCRDFTADTPFFENLNQNYNVTQFYSGAIASDEGATLVLGGTQDNGSSAATKNGISEFEQISWADGGYCAIDHEDNSYLYTTTQFRRMFRWRNGQRDTITNPYITDGNTRFINPMEMDPNDPQIIYQAASNGLWRFSNARTANASSWQACTRPFGVITAIGISKSRQNLVFIGRGSINPPARVEFAHITDNQTTPQSLDRDGELPQAYLNCIAVDPENHEHVILVYSNYDVASVWETWDAMSFDPSWTNIETDLPNIPVRWALFHPEREGVVYLATEMGMYYTDALDSSNTVWKKTNMSLPNLRMDMMRYRQSDGSFLIASHGRGIFTGKAIEGSNDIQWSERGPNNVGGRTRTLMIDPNEPSGRKLWAGSVSGGLWTADDVDSIGRFFEPKHTIGLAVFPNPAVDVLHVNFSEGEGEKHIRVYDDLGRLMFFQKVDHLTVDRSIDISHMAEGLYFVELRQADQRVVRKILVSRK